MSRISYPPTHRSTPVDVVGMTDAAAVALGYGSSCAVRSGGSLVCWGDNSIGQPGLGYPGGIVIVPYLSFPAP